MHIVGEEIGNFKGDMRTIKKNQMEILGLKNTVLKLKTHWLGTDSTMNTCEIISEFEDNGYHSTGRGKKVKRKRTGLNNLSDSIKQSNIQYM